MELQVKQFFFFCFCLSVFLSFCIQFSWLRIDQGLSLWQWFWRTTHSGYYHEVMEVDEQGHRLVEYINVTLSLRQHICCAKLGLNSIQIELNWIKSNQIKLNQIKLKIKVKIKLKIKSKIKSKIKFGSVSFRLDIFAPTFLWQNPQGFYAFTLMLLYLCPNEITLLPLCLVHKVP